MQYIRPIAYYILFLLTAHSVWAVPTGRVRGTVRDPDGKPLEKVTITFQSTGEVPQKYTATTNAKGEYIHIGISPGPYRITPSKEGYTPVEYSYIDATIGLSDKPFVADFKMAPVAAQPTMEQKTPQESEQIKEAKMGVTLLNEGKLDEAITAFNKALAIDPDLASAHYNLGIAYEKKNQPEEARKHFQETIRIRPDFGEAYQALGDSLMSSKKFEEASAVLSKASELMPESYAAFYNLGVSYSNSGKYGEAENAYRKATEISPNEPVAHYQLAMSLLGQSKNAASRAEFQKYLELNPNAADKQEVQDLIKTLE